MEIVIKTLFDVIKYEPLNPTYVIRIFSPGKYTKPISERAQLIESPNYKKQFIYFFNDEIFNISDETNARKLIADFSRNKDGIESLLVHCVLGQNRSPAVAIALNDIFNLGNDRRELMRLYPKFNQSIYRRMVEIGNQRIFIK